MAVDYRTERVVRVCTDKSRQVVPLTVIADERSIELAPGDCIRVEARQVSLQPAEMLEPNTLIVAEVATLNGG